jgi:ribosomal protein S24E
MPVSTDELTNIKFITTNNIFDLPLLYAGNVQFLLNFKTLNKNVTDIDSQSHKYKIMFDIISENEMGVKIVLQSAQNLTVYKFTDKLIKIVKMEHHEVILERSIEAFGYRKHNYLIDVFNNEVLLVKQENGNISGKGFMKKLPLDDGITETDLTKFVTLDIECKAKYFNDEDFNLIPILIGSIDFYHKETDYKFSYGYETSKTSSDLMIQDFLCKFLQQKYHGFKFYAHNLSAFDGILF